MRKFRSFALAGSAVLGGAFLPSTSRAAQPVITNLGTIGANSRVAEGFAINSSGQVAGFSWTTSKLEHAFRYTPQAGGGGTMVDLGTLGGADSRGTAINDSGQVAGFSKMPGSVIQFTHAFRYTGSPGSGGVMADLGTLGGDASYAWGINAAGQVVGESYTFQSANNHAFLYTGTPGSGGVMQDLGTLGGSSSIAYGINDGGQVTGQSSLFNNNGAHAFLYTGVPGAGGVMRSLGTLGGTASLGYAINNSGQVTGYSLTTANAETHMIRYVGVPGAGGTMQDLGTLPGGTASRGLDIDSFGNVAGYSTTSGVNNSHATLYVGTPGAGGRMIDLDAWLDATDPTVGARWTIYYAYGINDSGLVAGFGSYNDGVAVATAAFVLDASSLVPEPAGALMALLSFAGLLSRRQPRRRRR